MDDRLDGWKEIAAFIRRSEDTAQRRAAEGMPVYKIPGNGVYAYKTEIRQWERRNAVTCG